MQCMYTYLSILTDQCVEAGTSCNGGQTVLNPWFIVGGVASAVTQKTEFIMYVRRCRVLAG